MSVPNVLATRYASDQMRTIWSPESKIVAERRLWIAVLKAQKDLGVDFGGDDAAAVIADYERVIDSVDLASIDARERVTRHDVKARIEEFNALAGHEHVHKGMTSRDLTENIEQFQVLSGLKLVRERIVTVLVALSRLAVQYRDQPLTGRSHNVAAQPTTLGKRFATAADELLVAYARVNELINRYPPRGIKGPMGTARTCSTCSAAAPRSSWRSRIRSASTWDSPGLHPVGQVYPRSLDYEVLTALVQVAAAPSNAGDHDPADGGPRAGHRGLQGGPGRLVRDAAQDEHALVRAGQRLRVILRGYATMVGELAGDQWNEGDVPARWCAGWPCRTRSSRWTGCSRPS